MKIGLLVSGGLGFIIAKHLLSKIELIFIMTDKNSVEIISLAKENQISYFVGNPRGGKSKLFIKDKNIDVLISVNYLFLIEEDLISLPRIIAFNIHGSLLPKYRGRTPHVWAIINNEEETGISAHIIDKGCDTGDIIEQVKIPINYFDTGADILKKFTKEYIPLIDKVISKLESGKLKIFPQDESKATYFGKRSPSDGQINWNWQKERIRNWVRAQSYPYPGAFSCINRKKVTIDEVIFDETGFNYEMPNGLVLSVDPLLVKVQNGVLKILKFREKNIEIKEGQIFD